MIGDVRFQMPSMEGADTQEWPSGLREYLGSVGNAIAKGFQALAAKMNDPSLIMVPGGSGLRPLSDVMREDRWRPGDLKPTLASRADALRQAGWVHVDGDNGTPDSIDAFVIGGAEAADPADEVVGAASVTTSSPTPGVTDGENQAAINVWDGCQGVDVADDQHTHNYDHTHTAGVAAGVKSFTVIWMMKL